MNTRPLAVYANVAFALWIIGAILIRAAQRHQDPWWSMNPGLRFHYDFIVTPLLVAVAVAVAVGLLLLEEWGRQLALAWHSLLVFAWLMPVGPWLFAAADFLPFVSLGLAGLLFLKSTRSAFSKTASGRA